MSDFIYRDGQIYGLPASSSAFEYGERFVACRNCGVKRPGKEMKALESPQGVEPFCRDGCKTIVSNP